VEEKTKEKKRKRKSEVIEADVTMEEAPAGDVEEEEEDEEARKQRKKEKKEKKRREKEEAAKLEEQGIVSVLILKALAGGMLIALVDPGAQKGEKVQRGGYV
jgi:hypothetical protein